MQRLHPLGRSQHHAKGGLNGNGEGERALPLTEIDRLVAGRGSRVHYQPLTEVHTELFLETIDQSILEYAELYASRR